MTFAENLSSQLREVQKHVDGLSKEDISTAAKKLGTVLESKLNDDPYQAIAAAFGLGFGMGGLKGFHFKNAALYVGKLVALRSLALMDARQTRAKHVA